MHIWTGCTQECALMCSEGGDSCAVDTRNIVACAVSLGSNAITSAGNNIAADPTTALGCAMKAGIPNCPPPQNNAVSTAAPMSPKALALVKSAAVDNVVCASHRANCPAGQEPFCPVSQGPKFPQGAICFTLACWARVYGTTPKCIALNSPFKQDSDLQALATAKQVHDPIVTSNTLAIEASDVTNVTTLRG
ncbi:hypothetical protein WJX72_012509 [[Myrmecia] bisecta]|uniref:Antifreeze protein n=1 Tax=[Myrmecia] bisecta TaxID=41462 RepID=A0AAW1P5S9_9CHLO